MFYVNSDLYSQFFIVCIMIAFTPGAAILLAIKNTILHGASAAFYSSIGNTMIVFCYSLIASIASVYTMKLDGQTMQIIKYFGAGYLIYIAVNLFIKTVKLEYKKTSAKQNILFIKDGILVALSNPKMIVFYTVVWTSFIDTTLPLLPQAIIMTATLISWSIISLIVAVYLTLVGKKKYVNADNITKVNKTMAVAFLVVAYFIVK